MLSSTLTLASFLSLSCAVVISRREDSPYVYVPIEFLYGADSRVTTNITFGNSEPITVVMDTGSANAWIWQSEALVHWGSPYLFDPGPCNLTVPSNLTYNPLPSLTAHTKNQSSEYVYAGNSKIVQGSLFTNDTLSFASSKANFTTSIPNIQLALENSSILRLRDNGSCYPLPSYDKGIIGLSPYITTNTTQGPSFRQNLFDSSLILSKTMVSWFNTPPSSLSTLSGGILLGAIDTSKFISPLVRVPNVVAAGQVGYYVAKPTILFDGQTFVPDQNTTCLLDSGTHADYLPFDYTGNVGNQFFNNSEGMLVNENGVIAYSGSCDSIPRTLNISYTFSGFTEGKSVTIDIPLRNYARGAALNRTGEGDGGVCLLNLEVGGCTFGAPFYSGAVVMVDDERGVLALAQGGVSKEGSGIDAAALKVLEKGKNFDYV